MKSIFFGLSLVSAATAQIVNGVSSIPVTSVASVPAATPVPSSAAATPASGSASAPAAVTPAPGSQLSHSGAPAPAPPAQYTAPPAPGQDFYQYMPYNNWNSGGYKQLQCGYGYQKQADGLCVPFSWVSD